MIERYSTPEMKDHFAEDSRFKYMLQVEIAVAEVQAQMKLIPVKAAQDIKKKSKINVARIFEIEQSTKHDVIAFVSQVAETVGDNGKYIHFGLTSSDVLDTALSLQMTEALDLILSEIAVLKKTLQKIILKHKKTICPGRTHGIFAEITTFGFKMAGFLSELNRNEEKVKLAKKHFQICKLSGAVGTSSALPVQFEKNVAKLLGLKVEPFATQVIPRDRHAELMMSLAFLTAGYERLAVELRHLQRSEVSEVIEGFSKGQKGSSAMPHKKNPISAENITGLARLVKGYAWTAMENIPLWHERDISHSSNERVIFTDALTVTHYLTRRLNSLLSNIYIDVDRMESNTHLLGGVLYSSHLLLHLVDKHGLSREDSYKLIQSAALSLKPGEHLKDVIQKSSELKKYFTNKELGHLFSGEKHQKAIQDRFEVYQKEVF
jgi:adenylosuccinate lyase